MLSRTPNVVLIEPNPDCTRVLERLFGRDVRIITGAASNANAEAVLRIPDAGSGLAAIERNKLSFAGASKTIKVKTFRMDDLKLENVTFMKIDVEGHEASVLEGACELLKRDRPSLLVEAEERHNPGAVMSVRALLEPMGYEGYMLDAGTLVSVRRFDPAVHQSAEAAERGRAAGSHGSVYVNNFIFIPS
jgi:FkbM family methyltransferase